MTIAPAGVNALGGDVAIDGEDFFESHCRAQLPGPNESGPPITSRPPPRSRT